jgi:hypothetical protein
LLLFLAEIAASSSLAAFTVEKKAFVECLTILEADSVFSLTVSLLIVSRAFLACLIFEAAYTALPAAKLAC